MNRHAYLTLLFSQQSRIARPTLFMTLSRCCRTSYTDTTQILENHCTVTAWTRIAVAGIDLDGVDYAREQRPKPLHHRPEYGLGHWFRGI